jgi:hypothetical protein
MYAKSCTVVRRERGDGLEELEEQLLVVRGECLRDRLADVPWSGRRALCGQMIQSSSME